MSLRLIENQTEDLCKKAVILEWMSLKYVKNPADDVLYSFIVKTSIGL